ncbi:MAG: hypothetical protein ACE5R6_12160 [Candidatus Heimdallarchaeota archaeon]
MKLSDNDKAMVLHQQILDFFNEWKAEFEGITTFSELNKFWWDLIKRSEHLSSLVRQEIQFLKEG